MRETFGYRYVTCKRKRRHNIDSKKMKIIIYTIGLLGLFSCNNSNDKIGKVSEKDSLLLSNISRQDTTNNPCRQFNKLKTSDEYFQSANNRTKNCPYDSLTNLVALKEYQYAVKLDPKFWQAKRNYARQLYNFKEYENCIEQLDKTLELVSSESNPDLNVMRGQAFYKLGKFEESLNDYDIAIKYLGNTDYVHLLKAKAEWKLGQKDKACEDYKKAIQGYAEYEKEREFIDCKQRNDGQNASR